jgi:hypothetical protein
VFSEVSLFLTDPEVASPEDVEKFRKITMHHLSAPEIGVVKEIGKVLGRVEEYLPDGKDKEKMYFRFAISLLGLRQHEYHCFVGRRLLITEFKNKEKIVVMKELLKKWSLLLMFHQYKKTMDASNELVHVTPLSRFRKAQGTGSRKNSIFGFSMQELDSSEQKKMKKVEGAYFSKFDSIVRQVSTNAKEELQDGGFEESDLGSVLNSPLTGEQEAANEKIANSITLGLG